MKQSDNSFIDGKPGFCFPLSTEPLNILIRELIWITFLKDVSPLLSKGYSRECVEVRKVGYCGFRNKFVVSKKETVMVNKMFLQGKTLLLIWKVCYLQKQNKHTKTGC